MPNRARVLLADDHAIVREGLVQLLESKFEVVGAVGDGRDLVAESQRTSPDAVILDIGLPLLNGIEAARQIRELLPDVKIVFLTQQSGREYIRAAFRLGASGYVLKNAAGTELVTAISEVLAGRRYLCHELRHRFGDPGRISLSSAADASPDPLTGRQREVLQLVAEGKSAKEMAYILNISIKTVEYHKAHIMDELGIRTTAELTRYAIEHGMTPR
jgi:DNA-binding NarL/FixJ family response regulator